MVRLFIRLPIILNLTLLPTRGNILGVIVAFLESFKYTGHLIPIAFLRVYMGVYYLSMALAKYQGDFLTNPRLAEIVTEGLAFSTAPHWYQQFLNGMVVPYWLVFSYFIFFIQFCIGISFLLGYMVRPFCIIAIVMSVNIIALSPPDIALLEKSFIAINLMLCWVGAGRCIGFDYYYYKRMRGIFW